MTNIKIISGGQTGADKGGLLGARDLGLETGGFVPYRWRTENGRDFSLREFGLKELGSESYKVRTRRNVNECHLTLWFGKTGSPGFMCTQSACVDYHKDFFMLRSEPDNLFHSDSIRAIINMHPKPKSGPLIVNIAGNRESKNPGIEAEVRKIVREAFKPYAEGVS